MPRKKPSEVAYAEALGSLESLLIRHGVQVDQARPVATEWFQGLHRAGWRHLRPAYEPAPPDGTPSAPETAEAALEAARAVVAATRDVSP